MNNIINIRNKRAYHDYFIDDTIECGIVLLGDEIKSIRQGKVSIKESWVQINNNIVTIKNMNIAKFDKSANYDKLDEKRDRVLLLNKKEILKWKDNVNLSGYTIIPLELYINNRGKCKLKLGLVRGKHNYDKRETLKNKQIKRDMERAIN